MKNPVLRPPETQNLAISQKLAFSREILSWTTPIFSTQEAYMQGLRPILRLGLEKSTFFRKPLYPLFLALRQKKKERSGAPTPYLNDVGCETRPSRSRHFPAHPPIFPFYCGCAAASAPAARLCSHNGALKQLRRKTVRKVSMHCCTATK